MLIIVRPILSELSIAMTTSIQSLSTLQGHSRSALPKACGRCVVVIGAAVLEVDVEVLVLAEAVGVDIDVNVRFLVEAVSRFLDIAEVVEYHDHDL